MLVGFALMFVCSCAKLVCVTLPSKSGYVKHVRGPRPEGGWARAGLPMSKRRLSSVVSWPVSHFVCWLKPGYSRDWTTAFAGMTKDKSTTLHRRRLGDSVAWWVATRIPCSGDIPKYCVWRRYGRWVLRTFLLVDLW